MIGMAFRGWPIEAVEFYEGLEADNSKVYWQEHKAVYERQVKAPMEELLADKKTKLKSYVSKKARLRVHSD